VIKQFRATTQRLSPAGSRSNILRAASLVLLAGLAFATQQVQAAGNALLDISHVTLPGNKQQLALTLSGPVSEPRAFTIDNPARIALDLADTANQLDQRSMRISAGLLQNVTAVEAGGRTRVVINLASMTPYSTAVQGNKLFVTLDANANAGSDVTATQSILAGAQQEELSAVGGNTGHMINSIDFRRGPLGEGRILFDLSSAGVITDMRQEGGRVIVEFPDANPFCRHYL